MEVTDFFIHPLKPFNYGDAIYIWDLIRIDLVVVVSILDRIPSDAIFNLKNHSASGIRGPEWIEWLKVCSLGPS